MTNPSGAKGANAEREIAALLSAELGVEVVRKLGAGRAEDTGDLYGLEDTAAQVAWWPQRGVLRAVREKPDECEWQRINADATYCVSFIRLHGGVWRAVMTVPQWATYHREVTA